MPNECSGNPIAGGVVCITGVLRVVSSSRPGEGYAIEVRALTVPTREREGKGRGPTVQGLFLVRRLSYIDYDG